MKGPPEQINTAKANDGATHGSSRPPGSGKRLLTIPEAAEYLGVCVRTVRSLIWDGKLPQVRFTRKVLVDIHDLDRYIEAEKTLWSFES